MAAPTAEHRKRLQEARYLLRILEAGKPHPVPGHPVAGRTGVFVLPVPPRSIRGEQAVRLGYMPAREWAVADLQGLEPPVWEIEGQMLLTPVQVGGVRLDGYGWVRALEAFIRYFVEENRKRGQAKRPLLTLEWHDFYRGEHWEVVPMEVPLASQSAERPIQEPWRLRLRGLRPVGAAPKPPDPVRIGLKEQDPNTLVQRVCPAEVRGA
jgi:hypothetical protein